MMTIKKNKIKSFEYFCMKYIICEITSSNKKVMYVVQKPIKVLWIKLKYITVKTHKGTNYIFETFQQAKTALEERARIDYTNYLTNKFQTLS